MEKKAWQDQDHKAGDRWKHWLLCWTATDAEQSDKEDWKLGVKEKPLFDLIEVDQFVPPILHQMLGIGNSIMSHFLKFVEDLDLEEIPVEVL